jgi:hypothetical protein
VLPLVEPVPLPCAVEPVPEPVPDPDPLVVCAVMMATPKLNIATNKSFRIRFSSPWTDTARDVYPSPMKRNKRQMSFHRAGASWRTPTV